MAGPGAGPNGGQIYIDGFTSGNMPAKASIREVRINSNPFSPEYDRPGFGRIEIFTKPGSDKIRGSAFFQFNNELLNSRSPLLASALPAYKQRFLGFNLGGPIKSRKASFAFDIERRNITENAFVLATDIDSNFQSRQINQALVTPQTRTTISPRIDYQINATNTLVGRYQHTQVNLENEGVGSFNLASKAYTVADKENTLQLTETAILSPRLINETRFQFSRSEAARNGDNSTPALSVQGAFEGGGAQVGDSGSLTNRWELTNLSTYTRGTHTYKWGGRVRQGFVTDTSVNNFGGTYTFQGGVGPELDSSNQPIPGTSVQLQALERYQRTLLLQSLGYGGADIRLLGGGASFFSLSAGAATTRVNQTDLGIFVNDDWRIRPNLTLSYGLRYETQTNIGQALNLSPRLSVAWGIDGGANRTAKTVLRVGFGVFYDRISESTILQSRRFNGIAQQSYLLRAPDSFPAIPSLQTLADSLQSQQFQIVDAKIVAPRTYQASFGIDRQINRYARVSLQYIAARGVHLQRSRNINTPVNGVYPFNDSQFRFLTESTGFSRTHQIVVSPSINYKRLLLFGFYMNGYGETDAEGQPADPYNLRAEWGPSTMADVRHRGIVGTNLPLPWKISASPFLIVSSGSPYSITTGRDTNNDSIASERPALVTGATQIGCSGGSLVYQPNFGCFDVNPAPGIATIGRNYARGPANINLNLRVARSWSFGSNGESGMDQPGGMPPGAGGVRGGGGPPPGGPGGPGGGPPPGMFGPASGRKYNLTLSMQARNITNRANFASPSGDLSSPFFGEYRSLAGGFGPFGGNTTYSRKIDLQLRFTF